MGKRELHGKHLSRDITLNGLRLGLVGAGRWGRNFIRVLSKSPGLSLVAVASGNPETVTIVPPGCRITTEWRELLEPGAVDGIIVASPTSTHAQITLAAIAAGVPVLVEKPLALDSATVESLFMDAKRAGSIVMVDYIHLFNPAWNWMRCILDDLGPISAIHSEGGDIGPYRSDTPPSWDWLPHDLSLVLTLGGTMPTDLRARRTTSKSDEKGIHEIVELACSFPGDVRAEIRAGNAISPKCRRLTVSAGEGEVTYDDIAGKGHFTRNGKSHDVPMPGVSATPLENIVATFARAIESGSVPYPDTLALTMEITQIIDSVINVIGTFGETDWRSVILPRTSA